MSAEKKYKLRKEDIKQVVPSMGACFATDRITVDGLPVGYMYREAPDNHMDSGWRFFAGHESEEYLADPNNISIYDVNTIANYDSAIIPHLNSPEGTQLERVPGTSNFQDV